MQLYNRKSELEYVCIVVFGRRRSVDEMEKKGHRRRVFIGVGESLARVRRVCACVVECAKMQALVMP
jgi:hypothetical protein